MRSVGEAEDPRHSRSLPTASTSRRICFRFPAIVTSPKTNAANLIASINASPTIWAHSYPQSASRPLLNESNENKILVSSRITVYAFSQTALRKSGPFGAAEARSRRSQNAVAHAGVMPVVFHPMADGLSDLYRDLLTGSYDCVDRIVLNAYFRMGHAPGGFRAWWRALTGSDDTLENAHLMRLAGRFSRRLRGYAKAHDIPVIDCSVGDRKHDIAEEYLAKTKVAQGLFLILVGRAQAPVWDVSPNHHIQPKKPMPYVNHYSFHILDPEWGHVTIKISGHPPFPSDAKRA